MRTTMIVLLAVAAVVPRACFALEADRPMSAWALASDAERAAVIDVLRRAKNWPTQRTPSAVIACMNRAAEAPGHGDLPIRDMAEACSESSTNGSGQDDSEI